MCNLLIYKDITTVSVADFDRVTDFFCIVYEFCFEFSKFPKTFSLENSPKREPKISDSEIVTIIKSII